MKLRLATPGPTEVPQRLLLAGAREIVHHRSAEMEALIDEINAGLPPLFGTGSPVYTIASSGTGAMEAAVANCFSPGEEVLIVSNGYFGERFQAISRAYGLTAHVVESPWGTSISPREVADAHARHPGIRGVLVVYSETSTGALNDVRAIGEIFRDTDAIVVVDAISGLLVHPVEMDAWGLDVVLGASHKGFMLPPGLAFIALSDKAWTAVERSAGPNYYWSFQRLRQFYPMSSSSPAVSLLLGLHESLKMLGEEGLDAFRERHAGLGRAAERALVALGFSTFIQPPHRRSNVITAALAPEGIDTGTLLKTLSVKYGVTVTGGQAHLKGKLLRIGHVGAADALDLCAVFGALEMALLDCGHRFTPGTGTGEIVRTVHEGEN
ncbi:aspartate aminotransferase-like enzyme [Streptomyces griseochromogenes]|uniref:Aspartate aminotransferase-like enzyme n=1 Tax=Streptomyces griseochromogenes TaxID=68214 RepID=A0A1B1B3S1_9ACTN|nr:alanine--glyoxylate aminotransferase family protein [Streptomyces griseochromogenes]ANP53478.1 hydrogenase [Streptomyces griseochromogenes]MBP2054696.1 aspartate aminotransferase-like enzyme [Streptomyces griseochromogenes]